jgi:hypothetical protein
MNIKMKSNGLQGGAYINFVAINGTIFVEVYNISCQISKL